jgi:C-terminal processing protease CtpA/Prc
VVPGIVVEPRPAKVAEIEPGIFYVNVDQITDNDWHAALPRLEKAQGIVFDFRGYPGNLKNFLDLLRNLTRKPMTAGEALVPQARVPDRVKMDFVRIRGLQVIPAAPYLGARKAFLTDGRVQSRAETYLGYVEDSKLGELVGGPTAGTNGDVNGFTLPAGYQVAYTGLKWLKQDGSRHHGVGILPTIPVARTREAVAAGRDEILERGIQAVKAQAGARLRATAP